MNQDDPEKRIADLERQLAERQLGAGLPPASREAAASGSFTSYKWARPAAVNMARKLKPCIICVTTHGLTVDEWPGDVFGFRDAQLGLWVHGGMTMGTALHLQCGDHRFIVGGRDYRVATNPQLEAAPVDRVDVWMWASHFYELLTGISSRSGSDVRGAAPGEPTRCWLVSGSTLLHASYSDTLAYNFKPSLAIDVGNDAIWVIDPYTNSLVASAWLAQLTATPSKHEYPLSRSLLRPTAPILVVGVPGVQPLSIGCLDRGANGPQSSYRPQGQFRFSWRDAVREGPEPAYWASGADWLTLVAKLECCCRTRLLHAPDSRLAGAEPSHPQANIFQNLTSHADTGQAVAERTLLEIPAHPPGGETHGIVDLCGEAG
jgi:hypothetical protein